MRRALLFLFVFLFGFSSLKAQTLSSGDIAIIGVNADNPDLFGFVTLVDLPAGTIINFTDHGWRSSGSFRENEQVYTYTAVGTVAKGTVIQVADSDGAPQFSSSGDQLIAFQGTVGSPTHIYAVNFSGNDWQTDATSSNTSALPSGLVNGSTAVAVDECDNIAYTGPTTGSKGEILTAVGDKTNWTCDNTSRLSFQTAFTINGGGSNSIPVFSSPTLSAEAVTSEQVSITYTASDADSDVITYGGIGLPTGSSIDSSTGVFTWIPTEDQAGTNTFTITATDGTDTASISLTITVLSSVEASRPEVVSNPLGAIVEAGQTASISFLVKDPEGGALTYSFPAGTMVLEETSSSQFPGETSQLFQVATDDSPGIDRYVITITDSEQLSTSVTVFVANTGVLFPGETENTLLLSLQQAYTPNQTLGYDVARDTMYAKIDLGFDGVVRGIYTGFGVPYVSGDPSTTMFNAGINAEHSWPQSMGADNEPQRSDMHALFPAKSNVNSTRNNNPYAEIPDNETSRWFLGGESSTAIPTTNIDSYSEFASGRFEPRESVKGDVSRAVFYFNTIYEGAANRNFFSAQRTVLGDWTALDAPSPLEVLRSGRIATYQGNVNPFILDPSLPTRLFGLSVKAEESVPVEFEVGYLYPNPARDSVSFNLKGLRTSTTYITIYDVLGRSVGSYEASEGVNTITLSHLSPAMYSVHIDGQSVTSRRTLIKIR